MYPIIEFDSDSKPVISPSLYYKTLDGVEHCVICFFKEVIEKVVRENNAVIKATLNSEIGDNHIYEIAYKDKKIAFFHPYVGAPLAAVLMEEAIAHGYTKFVACGGAGVLDREIQAGKIIIPYSAVRDEGTSYHYVEPSREIEIPEFVISKLIENLEKNGIPCIVAKTWTTDAFYRETEKRRDLRKKEGCLTVEMECSAFAAVAKHRNVLFGQYLYGGDDISCSEYDDRNWLRHTIREQLFWLSVEACLSL